MHALRAPTTAEAPGTVTSNPNDIKQILYEFHSGLGHHNRLDRRIDTNHMTSIENEVTAVPLSKVRPKFCEMDITNDEVLESLTKLENNKAPGLDGILNEALKRGGDPMISALASLFNLILRLGISPSIWQQAMILPIFKDGGLDPLEASLYRPISLTSCVFKVYERVLLNRLTTSLEDRNKLPEEQVGFRKDRCTLEQAFILQEIMDSRKAHKAIYACFIDLTNAFGSTWQDGMWYQLQATGVKGKLYRSIRLLYNQCKSAISTPSGLTDWFTSDLGTRQGAVLLPLLFSLLVNPLANLLKSQGFGVHLGDIHIACLLYAEDLVLIADSEAQLRDMLETAT
jgi:hypothetical protein